MLSYLSSWLEGYSNDDPLDVVCMDCDEEDNEWVWVVVTSRNGEDIETVLEEYIVIPPCPAAKNEPASASSPKTMPYKNALRRDSRVRKKKRYCTRLKIYPPLKIHPKGGVKKACLRHKHRAAPYECVRDDMIKKSLEKLQLDLTMPQIVPDIDDTTVLETCSPSVCHPITVTRDSQGFCFYKPRTRTRPRVICDPFESLSAKGWSVLVDPNGEFLSSSMVRIWSIRNRLKQHEQSRLLESLGAKSLTKVLERSVEVKHPLMKNTRVTCSGKRRKRGRKHELTAKPGHTSLLNKKPCELSIVPWYNTDIDLSPWYDTVWPVDEIRLSRRMKSLMRTYKEVFLTIQYYLAQLLDSLVSTDEEELPCCERKRGSEVKAYEEFSAQGARSAFSCQKRNQKMNGKKKLDRWNAAQMKRRDRAACRRKRAMGRGRNNCAIRRAF